MKIYEFYKKLKLCPLNLKCPLCDKNMVVKFANGKLILNGMVCYDCIDCDIFCDNYDLEFGIIKYLQLNEKTNCSIDWKWYDGKLNAAIEYGKTYLDIDSNIDIDVKITDKIIQRVLLLG